MTSGRILTRLLWLCAALMAARPATAERILFVGNSFTYGGGSPVRFFHPELVHDLNRGGLGGVPALFKLFALQAGLDWDVSLETEAARDFAYHLASRKAELAGTWDVVVLQDYSTLEKQRPGDAGPHIRDAARLAANAIFASSSARGISLPCFFSRPTMIRSSRPAAPDRVRSNT